MKTSGKEMASTREAQRRYRSKQKAKLEDYRQEVETLKAKLAELDLKRAGLTSQNRILEETAAAVQAKNERAAKGPPEPQRLWDERSGKCLADFFNNLRADTLVVEMSAEEGRRLSTSDLILLLQEFYNQLIQIVSSPAPDNIKSRSVARLINAKGQIRDALEHMGPKYTALLQISTEKNGAPPPSMEIIKQGLDSLQLSAIQKQELLTSRNKLLRRFAEIKRERMDIIRRIHEVIERDRDKGDEFQSAMTLLEEVNATDELKTNLHQEHTSFLRFQNDLNESLTPLQFAKALALKQTSAVTMWALLQLLNRLHTEPQKCAALPPIDPRSLGPEPQDYAVIPESWNRTSSGSQSNSATSSDTALLQNSSLLDLPSEDGLQASGSPPLDFLDDGIARSQPSMPRQADTPQLMSEQLNDLQNLDPNTSDMLLDMPDPLDIGQDQENEQMWKLFQDIFNEDGFSA